MSQTAKEVTRMRFLDTSNPNNDILKKHQKKLSKKLTREDK